MRGGDHEQVGPRPDTGTVGDQPAICGLLDTGHRRALVKDPAGLDGRAQTRGGIGAEQPPLRKEIAVRARRFGIASHGIGRSDPFEEILRPVWEEAHPGRRHVDAMCRIFGIVGQAAAQLLPRFEDNDLGETRWQRVSQMQRHAGAGNAAADDRHDLRFTATGCHPAPAFKSSLFMSK